MIQKRFDIANPFESFELYDYAALESLSEFKELASSATVIAAVDTKRDRKNIVFGRETLRAIAAGVIPPQELHGVAFVIDFDTDHVEHLVAAVSVVKGYHEWDEVPATLGS
jgi:hypothetical protein